MNIDIKIISLSESIRRDNVRKQLDGMYQFEFFDAITRENEHFNSFDIKKSKQKYGRNLRDGEVGCSLSHRLVIEDVRSNSNWIVVLEDDFLISDMNRFSQFLNSLVIDDEPVCYLLGHSKTVPENLWLQRLKQPLEDVVCIGGSEFGKNDRVNYCGTVSYVMNRKACDLVKKTPLDKCFALADDWSEIRKLGINVLHPMKPIIYEDFFSGSTTGNKIEVEHSLSVKPLMNSLSVIKTQFRRLVG